MISTKELRIGNYVKYKNKTIIVDTIYYNSINMDITDCDGIEINLLQPIPLTEEWLLKFGFEFDTIDWQFSYPSCYFIGWYAGKWCLGTQSDGVLKETYFEYVHQLQNLYFALTGEELTQVSEGEK